MKIELATTAHLNDVANLFNDYRIFYEQPSDINGAKSFIKDRLNNKDSIIFVASSSSTTEKKYNGDNNKPVGFTQLYPTFSSVSMKRQYVLNDLFVTPDCRRDGVGKALIQHAQDFAINEQDCKGLALATAYDNVVAQSLYEQLGFIKDETFYHYSWTVPTIPSSSASDLN